jgi:molybdenum-dependent DNA-binding transcriptional regulator ModE
MARRWRAREDELSQHDIQEEEAAEAVVEEEAGGGGGGGGGGGELTRCGTTVLERCIPF